jgi:hypothetical protein
MHSLFDAVAARKAAFAAFARGQGVLTTTATGAKASMSN